MADSFARTLTRTHTGTYTRLRLDVIQDQFDLMLRYASVDKERRGKILSRISEQKVQEIGLYIVDEGYLFAQVSLAVDWDMHTNIVNVLGPDFDINRPGWEEGVCPEVDVAAHRIANVAKDMEKRLRIWIRFTDAVRSNPAEHKALCDELGFDYKSGIPSWRDGFLAAGGECPDLPEMTITLENAK